MSYINEMNSMVDITYGHDRNSEKPFSVMIRFHQLPLRYTHVLFTLIFFAKPLSHIVLQNISHTVDFNLK